MDINPVDISQTGWAIVFHSNEDPAVKNALAPLIDHRTAQIGPDKTRILEYRPGETWREWLTRHQVGVGSIIPTKIPYYVLLIGNPDHIPFDFQNYLDVEYAVGRLSFETAAAYAHYAESVKNYETSATIRNKKTAVFFGPRHPFDGATTMSADLLLSPLADGIPGNGGQPAKPGVAQRWGFASCKFVGNDATKATLSAILQSNQIVESPAFLFTASHGMGWPKGHPNQKPKQGALLCQDWPGIGQIHESHYFAGSDVPANAQVHGMINFHFACYSAGTPLRDNFLHEPEQPPPHIADDPFVAMLPKQLLAHDNGSTLAVIGHNERAWGYSIVSPGAGPQLLPFENTIARILVGQPVGYAVKDFNERYAALSTNLSGILEEIGFGADVPDLDLASSWIERNDAQNYVIIGDPAVRLRVEVMN
jgi:hypothetical protein